MKISFRAAAAVVACLGITSAALAQNAGTVTNHAFALGKGAGNTGYTSLLCGSAQLAVGQAAADPICQTITGDVTISAAGVTAIGAAKVTNAMLAADVFSTAHTWSAAQSFTSTINKLTFTPPATGATISFADNSTFNTTGAFATTLNSTGATLSTLPSGTHTLAALDVAQSFTAAQTFPTGPGFITLPMLANVGAGTIPNNNTGGAGPFVATTQPFVANSTPPPSPAAGFVAFWTDSADLRLHDKNSAGAIGTTVVSSAAALHQFANSVSTAGVVGYAQPSFADISGRSTLSQLPQGVANSIWINPTASTADMQNVAVPACANDGVHALVYINGTGLQCATITVATAALPPKYWAGLTHSNNVGTPNTKIDIASGKARDSTDTQDITVASGTIDCTIVGANGLDAGALAANTKYYTFAIAQANGTQALLASLSPTAPTLPATYTKFRRIGFFKTASGAATILAFKHINDRWYWDAGAIRDVNTNTIGTTFVNSASLSVPNVQGVTALFAVTGFASVTTTFFVAPTFISDAVGNGFAYAFGQVNGGTIIGQCQVDSSGMVKLRSTNASTTIVIDTAGWIDPL